MKLCKPVRRTRGGGSALTFILVASAVARAQGFYTVTPCRVFDSRDSGTPIGSSPLTISPPASGCGVPSDAIAIAGNLTAVPIGYSGTLNLYPSGPISNLGTLPFNSGTARANNVTMPLSMTGTLDLSSSNPVHAVLDVSGYFREVDCHVVVGSCPGHYNTQAREYPFTEDITSSSTAPYASPLTITGPTYDWTTIQAGCSAIGQKNLRASSTFNALVRAGLVIGAAPNMVGSRYELRFMVNGVPWGGWYMRRIRSGTPVDNVIRQVDQFQGTVLGLGPGTHQLSLQARLLDSGSITLHQQWLNAAGAPVAYPGRSNSASTETTISDSWSQISSSQSFSNSGPLDLELQGYLQVNSASVGARLEVAFSLDGQPAVRTADFAAQGLLPDSASFMDHLWNVSPGSHTIALWARTAPSGASAVVQFAQAEMVSFPSYTGSSAAAGEAETLSSTVVDYATPEQQPTNLYFDATCGRWTRLLDLNIPAITAEEAGVLEAYVELLGNISGDGRADIAFQYSSPEVPFPTGFEMGVIGVTVPSGIDGVHVFGDVGQIGCRQGCAVTLWMRKLSGCGAGGPGSFTVGKRHMSMKFIPVTPGTCVF